MELHAWHYSTSLIMCPLNRDYLTDFITEEMFKSKHSIQM